jgi:NAD(P)-dependent dehydrogenase (short-subunit alcohol dehydrogenase family)
MQRAGPLQGRTAVITGASGAIGFACARLLAADGAAVLLMARRADALESARRALLEQVPDADVASFAGDACDEAAVKAALKQAHALQGRLDMLVPTVGGGTCKPLLMEDAAGLTQEFTLSVVSAFLMVKHGVPLMEPGGSIVCVSSTAGARPAPGLGAYSIGKAALEMFVQIAADELGGAGIRVNAVRPGLTRSDRTAGMVASEAALGDYFAQMPLGRVGEGEDIGRAVRFLAGPESCWITGQSLAADGGLELRRHPDSAGVLDAMYGQQVMEQVRRGRPPGT